MKINRLKVKRFTGAVLALGLITILSSCLKTKDSDYVQPYSAFAVVNAYPNMASFDFAINGAKINTQPLLYKENTDYIQLYSGTYEVDILKANTDSVLAAGGLSFYGGKYYSLFISPNMDETKSASATGVLAEDDPTAPTSGKAKLRFANLTSDAGKFDVYTDGNSGAVKTLPDTLFNNKGYLAVSSYKEVDPSAARYLQVHEAGKGDAKLEIPLSLEAGKIYTVYCYGLLSADPGTGKSFGAKLQENKFQ